MNPHNILTKEQHTQLATERLLELRRAGLFVTNRKVDLDTRQFDDKIADARAMTDSVGKANSRAKSNPL